MVIQCDRGNLLVSPHVRANWLGQVLQKTLMNILEHLAMRSERLQASYGCLAKLRLAGRGRAPSILRRPITCVLVASSSRYYR
jgi:hypothetical protein